MSIRKLSGHVSLKSNIFLRDVLVSTQVQSPGPSQTLAMFLNVDFECHDIVLAIQTYVVKV